MAWRATRRPNAPSPRSTPPRGGPVFNPLIAHFADGRERRAAKADFDDYAKALGARLLAGAADDRRPGAARTAASACSPAPGSTRSRLRVPAHPVAQRADRGGGRSARRAVGQPLGPRQPDARRPCRGRPRRPHRLDSRRRADAARPRIRRSSPALAARRACCGPARWRASGSRRRSASRSRGNRGAGRRRAARARHARLALRAARPAAA